MLSWDTAHELALALPEAKEQDHFGSPSFRVRGKIFAQLSPRAGKQARVLVKLPAADQAALTMSDPETFASEPQWGRHGWTYVHLATAEAGLLRSLLLQSWQQMAPKELAARVSQIR